MQLDSFTLVIACCGLLTLLGGVFLFLWLRDRQAPALVWWSIPFIFSSIAATVYLRSGWEADAVALALGNATRIFAVGCLWQGTRIFERRGSVLHIIVAVCAAWIGLCSIPEFVQSMAARIVVVSLISCAFTALCAWELWRDRREALRSRFPTILVFLSFTVLMALRISVVQIAPFPVGALPADPLWLAVFMWVVVGHATFAAVLFLTMTMERREAEQRSFALSDPLTGLMNRRAFADFAARINRRRAGIRSSMALLVLDLDHFKSVNDRFGHEVGDRMLKAFSDVAESSVRPSDQLFRMGGEEFCFALPETSQVEAVAVAERVRKAFENSVVETPAGPARGTVSIGIAATQFAVEIEVLLAAADAAVYEAKARGRNRVVVAEPNSLLRPANLGEPPYRRSA